MNYSSSSNILLSVAQILAINLPYTKERIVANKWIKKFGLIEINLQDKYLPLFMFCLQQKTLVEPFSDPPLDFSTEWKGFQKDYSVDDMKTAIEQKKFNEMKMFDYKIDVSQDLKEFVAYQEISNFGAHFYFAVSFDPITKWSKFSRFKVPRQLHPEFNEEFNNSDYCKSSLCDKRFEVVEMLQKILGKQVENQPQNSIQSNQESIKKTLFGNIKVNINQEDVVKRLPLSLQRRIINLKNKIPEKPNITGFNDAAHSDKRRSPNSRFVGKAIRNEKVVSSSMNLQDVELSSKERGRKRQDMVLNDSNGTNENQKVVRKKIQEQKEVVCRKHSLTSYQQKDEIIDLKVSYIHTEKIKKKSKPESDEIKKISHSEMEKSQEKPQTEIERILYQTFMSLGGSLYDNSENKEEDNKEIKKNEACDLNNLSAKLEKSSIQEINQISGNLIKKLSERIENEKSIQEVLETSLNGSTDPSMREIVELALEQSASDETKLQNILANLEDTIDSNQSVLHLIQATQQVISDISKNTNELLHKLRENAVCDASQGVIRVADI